LCLLEHLDQGAWLVFVFGDDAVHTGPQLILRDYLAAGTTAGANLCHHLSPDADFQAIIVRPGRPAAMLTRGDGAL